jgi:hypothetical protein
MSGETILTRLSRALRIPAISNHDYDKTDFSRFERFILTWRKIFRCFIKTPKKRGLTAAGYVWGRGALDKKISKNL